MARWQTEGRRCAWRGGVARRQQAKGAWQVGEKPASMPGGEFEVHWGPDGRGQRPPCAGGEWCAAVENTGGGDDGRGSFAIFESSGTSR